MNTKHTPGPWIDRHWDGNQQIVIVASAFRGPNQLALVRPPLTLMENNKGVEQYECRPRDVAEAGANARLIAAAPELLEACEAALGAYDALQVCGASKHLPGYESCLSSLKAAISKATA